MSIKASHSWTPWRSLSAVSGSEEAEAQKPFDDTNNHRVRGKKTRGRV
jgi:hypothetical protein